MAGGCASGGAVRGGAAGADVACAVVGPAIGGAAGRGATGGDAGAAEAAGCGAAGGGAVNVGRGVDVGTTNFGAAAGGGLGGLAAGGLTAGGAGVTTGLASTGGAATGGGATAGPCCLLMMAFRASPGLEMWERSILVLISSASARPAREDRLEVCPWLAARKCARTFSASWSSRELEWLFFSVTPISGSTSRIDLLLTSSSLARSLIRILLIRPLLPPGFPVKSSSQPHGSRFGVRVRKPTGCC